MQDRQKKSVLFVGDKIPTADETTRNSLEFIFEDIKELKDRQSKLESVFFGADGNPGVVAKVQILDVLLGKLDKSFESLCSKVEQTTIKLDNFNVKLSDVEARYLKSELEVAKVEGERKRDEQKEERIAEKLWLSVFTAMAWGRVTGYVLTAVLSLLIGLYGSQVASFLIRQLETFK